MSKLRKFMEKENKSITQLDKLILDVRLDNPENLNYINHLSIRNVASYGCFKQFKNFKKIGYLLYKGVDIAQIGYYSIYGDQNSDYNMKIEFLNFSLYNGACFDCIQILEEKSKWERRINEFHIAFDYNGFSYIDWWYSIYENSNFFLNGKKKKNPIKLHNRSETEEQFRKKKKSATIYIGEFRGARYLRIYNKTIELEIPNKGSEKKCYMDPYYKKNGIDINNVERLELELRKRSAHKYLLQDLFQPLKLNQILNDELLGKKNAKGDYIHSFFRFTKPERRNGKKGTIDITPIRFDKLPKQEIKLLPQEYKRATIQQQKFKILKPLYKDVYVGKNQVTEKYFMHLLNNDFSQMEYFKKKHVIWEKEWDSEPRQAPAFK